MAFIKDHPSTGKPTVYWRDPITHRQKQKSCPNKTLAKAFKSQLESDIQRGDYIDPDKMNKPYREWAEQWWDLVAAKMGEARQQGQRGYLDNHILPKWGSVPIGRIDSVSVARWANLDLPGTVSRRRGVTGSVTLSGATVGEIIRLFTRSLRAAAAAKWIRETPVDADLISVPSATRKKERFLDSDELDAFLDGLEGETRTFCEIAPWTGMGWGEIAGLRRSLVDVHRKRITIARVAYRDGAGNYALKEVPKNHYRRRTIAISERLAHALRFQLERAKDYPDDLLFASPKGRVLNYSNWREDVFAPAVQASGLESFTFHDLRHTHVSWLIDAGWDEFRIVKRLGWKDARVLYSTYGHLFDGHDRDLVDDLESTVTKRAEVIALDQTGSL